MNVIFMKTNILPLAKLFLFFPGCHCCHQKNFQKQHYHTQTTFAGNKKGECALSVVVVSRASIAVFPQNSCEPLESGLMMKTVRMRVAVPWCSKFVCKMSGENRSPGRFCVITSRASWGSLAVNCFVTCETNVIRSFVVLSSFS